MPAGLRLRRMDLDPLIHPADTSFLVITLAIVWLLAFVAYFGHAARGER